MGEEMNQVQLNGYKAFFMGREYSFIANDLWDAKQKAITHFKVPKSKQGLLAVVLVEKDGKPVLQSGAGL